MPIIHFQGWLSISEEINVPVPLKVKEPIDDDDSEDDEDKEDDDDDDDKDGSDDSDDKDGSDDSDKDSKDSDEESVKPKKSKKEDEWTQDAVPMNSLLLYICDGIIPFISSFCTQLEIQNSSGLTSKVYASLLTPKVLSVLSSMGEAIAVSTNYIYKQQLHKFYRH